MKKLVTLLVIPLFAGDLCAQTTQSTTTTTTIYNGTRLDAGCQSTHTGHKETQSDETATTTKTETPHTTECPVTSTTTWLGVMTPEGQFVRFDESGNTRIVEMVKKNKNWETYVTEHNPINVKVVWHPNGDRNHDEVDPLMR
jgi:hypothetical protein